MDRTSAYEDHIRTLESLRNHVIAARTLARAFDDYEAVIRAYPSLGSVADQAREDLLEYCRQRKLSLSKWAESKTEQADRMEAAGVE